MLINFDSIKEYMKLGADDSFFKVEEIIWNYSELLFELNLERFRTFKRGYSLPAP